MKKIVRTVLFILPLFFVLTFSKADAVFAADELILDTSNHYLGACGYTDTTTWTQETDLAVTTFQIWYYWQSGEGPVSFTLTKDGAEFLTGEVTRAACDPYQTSWCNGDLIVNKTFPAGSYSLKIANKKQCAIPSGNGAVRLYGAAEGTETSEASESALLTTSTVDDTKTDPSLTMIYDNTDNYLGGCQVTDATSWTSEKEMDVVLMQIWYSWEDGEDNVSFTLNKDGSEFAKGVFTKTSECQWTWCNGNYTINKIFPQGSTYALTLGNASMCQDPQDRGAVRLFGKVNTTETESASNETSSNKSDEKKSNTGLIIAGVAGGVLIIVAGFYFFLKKK